MTPLVSGQRTSPPPRSAVRSPQQLCPARCLLLSPCRASVRRCRGREGRSLASVFLPVLCWRRSSVRRTVYVSTSNLSGSRRPPTLSSALPPSIPASSVGAASSSSRRSVLSSVFVWGRRWRGSSVRRAVNASASKLSESRRPTALSSALPPPVPASSVGAAPMCL